MKNLLLFKLLLPIFAVLFFSNDGVCQLAWTKNVNATSVDHFKRRQQATDVIYGKDGNIYLTGYQNGGSINEYNAQIRTMKYNNSGIMKASTFYSGVTDTSCLSLLSVSKVPHIIADTSFNIFVSGNIYDSGSLLHGILIKYDSSLVQQWSLNIPYIDPINELQYPVDLDKDMNENLIVTMYVKSGGTFHLIIAKADNSGNLIWNNSVDSVGYSLNELTELESTAATTIDANNNVYVTYTRNYDSLSVSKRDIAVRKYNSSGMLLWQSKYAAEYAFGIATDLSGNVLVAGTKIVSATRLRDAMLLKYNSSGVFKIAKTFGNIEDTTNFEAGYFVASDDSGYMYIGSALSQTLKMDIRKYSPDGKKLIWKYYTHALISDMIVTGNGVVFVTGTKDIVNDNYPVPAYNTNTMVRYKTVKLDNLGKKVYKIFTVNMKTPETFYAPSKLCLSNDKLNLILVGRSDNTSMTLPAWFIEKFTTSTVRIENQDDDDEFFVTNPDGVLYMYPNPANDKVSILSEEQIKEVVFYDVTGRTVKHYNHNSSDKNLSEINITDLKSGVYICKIITSEKTFNRKLMKQ